jgi:hypothetical protein
MLFLNEIEEILLVISQYPEQFVVVQEMVFKKFAECIASPHFQVRRRDRRRDRRREEGGKGREERRKW